MKVLLLLAGIFLYCHGEEKFEETSDLFKTKLWQEIHKRLFENGDEAGLQDLKDAVKRVEETQSDSAPRCPSGSPNVIDSITSNTIIKTSESVKSGAAFLASPKISSAIECLENCCKTTHCNLVVYENKKKNACYLFDCGNPSRCDFTDHANYTSIILRPAPPIAKVATTVLPVSGEEHHEDDLQGLVNNPPVAQPTEISQQRTKLPKTSTRPGLRPTTAVQAVQVKLFAVCGDYEICEDKNAVCSLEKYCVCKDGFVPKNGRCVLPEPPVSHCGRFQIECKDPHSVPKCIASYDRCDGVSQCADGSDEADCSPAYPQDYANSPSNQDQRQPDHPPGSIQTDVGSQNYRPQTYKDAAHHEQQLQNLGSGVPQPTGDRHKGDSKEVEAELPEPRQPVQQVPLERRPPSAVKPQPKQGQVPPQTSGRRPTQMDGSRDNGLNRKRPDLFDLHSSDRQQPVHDDRTSYNSHVAPPHQKMNPVPERTRPDENRQDYNQPQRRPPSDQIQQTGRTDDEALNRKRPDVLRPEQNADQVRPRPPDKPTDNRPPARPIQDRIHSQVSPSRNKPQELPQQPRIRPDNPRLQNTLHNPSNDDSAYQGREGVKPQDTRYQYKNTNPYQYVKDQLKPGQQGTYNTQYYNGGSYPHTEYDTGFHPSQDLKKPVQQGRYNQYYNQYENKDGSYDRDGPFNYDDAGEAPKYPSNRKHPGSSSQSGRYPDYYESTGYTDVNSNPYPDLSGTYDNNYHYNEGREKDKQMPVQPDDTQVRPQPDEPRNPYQTGPDEFQPTNPPVVLVQTTAMPRRPVIDNGPNVDNQGVDEAPETGRDGSPSHPDKTENQMSHPIDKTQGQNLPHKPEENVPSEHTQSETSDEHEVHSDKSKTENAQESTSKDQKQGGGTDQKQDKELKPGIPKSEETFTEAAKGKPTAAVDSRPKDNDVNMEANVGAPSSDDGGSFLPYGGSQGAIVALSLSLAITVILILFLGCRLRTVKRRLKRGRVLNSNEADYLINGMYL